MPYLEPQETDDAVCPPSFYREAIWQDCAPAKILGGGTTL
jgi:hypothetical protein